MDRLHPPKWATHTMYHQTDGEFCFLGKGIMASELYQFDVWEDEDYCEEYFKGFGWRIAPLKPIVLENK